MTGLVINKEKPNFDWSWESMALRTGLSLMKDTYCIGASTHAIMYRHTMELVPTMRRLMILINNEKDPKTKKALEQTQAVLRAMHKRKHRQKQDIIFLKRTEALINDTFGQYLQRVMHSLRNLGLTQLEEFYTQEPRLLNLWSLSEGLGETNGSGPLSEVLLQKIENVEAPEVDVFILFDEPAADLLQKQNPVYLATLPNLNTLEPAKLRNVHDRLRPYGQELEALLPLLSTKEDADRYFTGYWDLDGIKNLAPRLQQALDETPELQWAKNVHTDFSAQLHVGNMDTPELWQFLREKGLVPDDTWAVLSRQQDTGVYCPTSAFITITSEHGADKLNNLTEEETLQHKRKTIELD